MNLSKVSQTIDEETAKKHPHLKTYMACQSRAFVMGMATLVSSGAVVVVGQELVKKWIPMTIQMRVMSPVLCGSVIAYWMTRQRTKNCQNMWMALEGKHSVLNPIDEPPSAS